MAFANVDVQRSDAHTHAPTNIHSIMLVAEEIKIVACRLFDPEKLEFIVDQVITVSEKTGLIHDLKPPSGKWDPLSHALQGRAEGLSGCGNLERGFCTARCSWIWDLCNSNL